MSSRKVLIDMLRGIVQCVKGTPYNKRAYDELFKVLYELFRLAPRDGLISLESHLTEPENSAIFAKYPRFAANHHVMEFTCGALSPCWRGPSSPINSPGCWRPTSSWSRWSTTVRWACCRRRPTPCRVSASWPRCWGS